MPLQGTDILGRFFQRLRTTRACGHAITDTLRVLNCCALYYSRQAPSRNRLALRRFQGSTYSIVAQVHGNVEATITDGIE